MKIGNRLMKRSRGNVGDLMVMGIILIAMTSLMISFLHIAQLIEAKADVGQIARQYILRMETVGYLTPEDQNQLVQELHEMDVRDVDLGTTTRNRVAFGTPIYLEIKGKLRGEYEVFEKRSSTAKY